MKQTRTITHADHTDIETLINGVWAVTSCNVILQTKEDSMNNGHGQFTSQDAAEYIAEVSKTDSAVTICSCGAEVEAQPMKAGVCYECYRNPVTEAQQIERAIDATLHVEDLERRNEFPSYDELIKGAKFTDKHRADLHNWWNAKYSRG